MAGKKVGVLALQGDVSEHIRAFEAALGGDGEVVPVRTPADLEGCDALAIPGGESTTLARLIAESGLREAIQTFKGGIFATCAGMVLVATEINDSRFEPLGIVDITIERNAFGRQRESFEAGLAIEGLDEPFHAIFIRAPMATAAGPGVEVLGRTEQGIVAVRCGKHMVLSFHPELGGDLRLHRTFLEAL
ncbi:pyridoxal 5'-phosphate synthase glutaminase subunit PdxT [Methanofollis formosanus]|uniref:Pyridoxal 5'-phosphate synthase subunit PdxT n=1 Tax=Methanofollis formosanus TaxID=299308 RepID=A0A8G1A1M7_9EURY|nr:pyridoxal 5'-phosphate synthase glutaminase subunit PdxT [Methanofollis formosanus]QYZ79371.1 pyridoxal 5'-phosphate synthase glutaminase subunit PdxT [Methanofollis formosanus]